MFAGQRGETMKCLPVKIHNMYTTYLHFNFPLCTLLWNDHITPWLNEHFIHLYTMMHNTGVCWVDMLETDYFYSDVSEIIDMTSKDMEAVDDIVSFVIDNIDRDFYATIYTNEYYLPGRGAYQRYTHMHQTLLYGYDKDRQVLIGIGYDGRQRFIESEYPFEIFREAYEKGKLEYDHDFCWVKMHTAYLNRVYRRTQSFEARIGVFMEKLRQYIHEEPDERLLRSDNVIEMGKNATYGMGIYTPILYNLTALQKGEFTHDYRTFHLLAEHKRGLYQKMKYFAAQNGIYDKIADLLAEYEAVSRSFENVRLIYLRYVLVDNHYESIIGQLKDKAAIGKVYEIICDNAHKEYEALISLYDTFSAV